MQAEITVSFLTTAEDYKNERLDFSRLGVTKKEKTGSVVVGSVCIVGGIAGAVFRGGSALEWLAWVVILTAGLYSIFYFDLIFPYLVVKQAKKDYEKMKDRLFAQTITLTVEGIEIRDIRQTCHYPYNLLYQCVKAEHTLIFYLGIGNTKSLPLRLFSEEEMKKVETLLEEQLREKFNKL